MIPNDLTQAPYDGATEPSQAAPRLARASRWRQLHVRAALLTLPLLLLLCAAMLALLHYYSARAAIESAQRMNLGLARYVVEHQPTRLLDGNGKPDGALMRELAQHVMMINPSVEVYMLDGNGRVIAHALELTGQTDPVGREVDLSKVRALLNDSASSHALPIYGDDPRSSGRDNIVSVAALGTSEATRGYLYIVLNGLQQQTQTATLANSNALREVATGVVLATLAAMLIMLIVLRQLTRPLRELSAALRDFRGPADVANSGDADGEIGLLRQAAHAMQARIGQQFKRLEDSDNQRRELISSISHDLRTPLSSIQGYVQTVLVRGDSLEHGQRAELLNTALRHIELLGRRISDLFELSKLDAGRVAPKYEIFCLAELLQDVVQNYQLSAQQRGVKLHLSAGSHLKTRVSADIALIERVLQNLIDNALRHTPCGGQVTLSLDDQGALVEICVSDTGSGIALEHLPHIFDRYRPRRDAEPSVAGSRPTVSSGLGLAIVKRILDLHSSVVNVQSGRADGTQIRFGLQRAN